MSDLIERQAAIDAVDTFLGDYEISRAVLCRLWMLPSAQPEIIYCEDCKYADEKRIADGRHWCNLNNGYLSYCSEGERRTDE